MVDKELADIVGKTIRAVVLKEDRKYSNRYMQVFLVFTDSTYYELYSDGSIITTSAVRQGDIDDVRAYRDQGTRVIFEAERDDVGDIIRRGGPDFKETVHKENSAIPSSISPSFLPSVYRSKSFPRWTTPREELMDVLSFVATDRPPDMTNPNFTEIDLSGEDLSEVDYTGFLFDRSTFASTDFSNCNLRFSSFVSADCSAAVFVRANLELAKFTHARLIRADFSYANLFNANLHRANLKEAVFTSADLRNADLSAAEVFETDFSYADLRGANLQGLLKSDAIFTGAKF
jgi:uncharacterized protein YjbI with pentapeptide repeats